MGQLPSILPHTLRRLLVFTLLAISICLAWCGWQIHQPLKLPEREIEIMIPSGLSAKGVATTLQQAGVPLNAWLFVWSARLSGLAHKIKAGNYILQAQPNAPSIWQVLQKLVRGDVSQREIRFIEGWTFRQWRQQLNQHADLRHDTEGLSDQEIMVALGQAQVPDKQSPEGWFMPDTYLFDRQASDLQILRRALHMQQRQLDRVWQQRAADSPLQTPYQALILASIIEKESGHSADRAMIAGVFSNRLKKGMLLQTDPTIIYGIGIFFDGNLRRRDLLQDGPYNTYTRIGLPPTPIAMPGLAALQAAVQPAATDALYFVAKGDGRSEFSRTLDEHNRAVNRYQR